MSQPSSHRRVLEIDALRFIAAVMVVMFHWAFRGGATHTYIDSVYAPLLPAAQYGYLGVQLFFMISGFVILMSAQGRTTRQFAISRIVRLYPAFWACCTVTALLTLLFADAHFRVGAVQYLVNLTMLGDFLPGGIAPVDGVYWSLFVEIRFYVFVAIVVALDWLPRTELLLWLWLGVAALLRLLPTTRLSEWLLADYAPLFVAGASCYLMHSLGVNWRRLLLLGLSFALALHGVMAGALGLARQYTSYPFNPLWAGVALATFYAVMFIIATRGIAWLRHPAALACGALTYPLYLLHQNIGYMVLNRLHDVVPPSLLFWGLFAAMLTLTWAVHRFIERPFSPRLKAWLERSADRLLALRTALQRT